MARKRRATRWIVDIAAAMTLVLLVVGTVWYQQHQSQDEEVIELVRNNVRRLEAEVKLRGTVGGLEVTGRGFPTTVDPTWFDDPPLNGLVEPDRPWIEVAPPEDADLQHPTVRLTIDEDLAGFWYNPYQGVVRARVPVMVSDERSLELYNRINSCALLSIFDERSFAPPPTVAEQQESADPPSETMAGTEPVADEEDEMDDRKKGEELATPLSPDSAIDR